jgi:hypothetical protein
MVGCHRGIERVEKVVDRQTSIKLKIQVLMQRFLRPILWTAYPLPPRGDYVQPQRYGF